MQHIELRQTLPVDPESRDSLVEVRILDVRTYMDTIRTVEQREESILIPADQSERRGHYVQAHVGAAIGSVGYGGVAKDDVQVSQQTALSGVVQLQYAYFFHRNVGVGVGAWLSNYSSYGNLRGEAYTFSGITLRGTQHLTAAFVAHDCSEAPSEDFTAPAMPILAATMEVDTVFDCGTKEYHVTVAVTAISQRGECYVLDSIVGGATTIRLIGSGTFTITRPATAELHYIVVRYPATGCEVVIPE